MIKTKLNKMEEAAKEVCRVQKAHNDEFLFAAQWKKSQYGYCPSIYFNSIKVAYAGGSGYCKESTALANFLCFLFTEPEDFNKVQSMGGVGFDSLARELAVRGWCLTKNDSSNVVTAYHIRRLNRGYKA